MMDTLTEMIDVTAESFYISEQSDAESDFYVFAYQITIVNDTSSTVQLLRRHWKIIDGNGKESHVDGEGVVGEKPILQPGESYDYMSGSHLETPIGTMEGYYEFRTHGGRLIKAPIPCFTLQAPGILN